MPPSAAHVPPRPCLYEPRFVKRVAASTYTLHGLSLLLSRKSSTGHQDLGRPSLSVGSRSISRAYTPARPSRPSASRPMWVTIAPPKAAAGHLLACVAKPMELEPCDLLQAAHGDRINLYPVEHQ